MSRPMAMVGLLLAVVAGLLTLWLFGGLPFGLSGAQQSSEETRSGILAPFDLDDGHYALVVSLGEQALRDHPEAPLVRFVDDQELIARYRDEIDIRRGFTDFLPGEGRPHDVHLYAYRNGEQVAGMRVTQASRIHVPDAVIEASRVVRRRDFTAGRDDYMRERERLLERGFLLVDQAQIDPDGYDHFFFAQLPTVTVSPDEPFDPHAYAEEVTERIRADVGDGDFKLSVTLRTTQEDGTIPLYDETTGTVLQDAAHNPVMLSGVVIHHFSLFVEGVPEIYEVFRSLDLDSYVAEKHDKALLQRAWLASTGTDRVPTTIRIDDYRQTAALGRLDRRTYTLAWVEPNDPVDVTMTTQKDDGLSILSAEDTPDRIDRALKAALVGRRRAEVVPILTEMGARGAYAYDFMETGLAPGTELGNGYRAGDRVLTVIFGLTRGSIQPDRRLRIYLEYGSDLRPPEEDDKISWIREIEYHTK